MPNHSSTPAAASSPVSHKQAAATECIVNGRANPRLFRSPPSLSKNNIGGEGEGEKERSEV